MHKQKGFTLIEVLVASALGLVLLMGITQLYMSQFRALASVRLTSEANNLVTLARLALSNEAICQVNITGGNFSPSAIPHTPPANFSMTVRRIDYIGGNVLTPTTSAPSDTSIIVWPSSISLSNFRVWDATNRIYQADLSIVVTKRGVVMGGGSTRQKISMQFRTNAAGAITDCAANSLSAPISNLQLAQVCTYLGGTVQGTQCALPQPAPLPTQPAPTPTPLPFKVTNFGCVEAVGTITPNSTCQTKVYPGSGYPGLYYNCNGGNGLQAAPFTCPNTRCITSSCSP